MILGAIFTSLVALVMMGLAFSRGLNRLVNWLLDKLENKFTGKTAMFEGWRQQANQLNETGLYIIHHMNLLFKNILADCVKFIAIYMIPTFILYGKCSASPIECVMLLCVISMVDVIIPIPSGVGSFEFLSVLFFEQFATSTDVLAAILVYRFATWIVPFFVGMILWIVDKTFLSREK